jgi:hypothetical protein
VDPNGTSAWNAVLSGRKKWILYPPDVIPPGVKMSEDNTEISTPTSLIKWFRDYYPHIGAEDIGGGRRRYECVTKPGDVMFVPSGWWHCVLNIEESVAITHNFVYVLCRFPRSLQSQCSEGVLIVVVWGGACGEGVLVVVVWGGACGEGVLIVVVWGGACGEGVLIAPAAVDMTDGQLPVKRECEQIERVPHSVTNSW